VITACGAKLAARRALVSAFWANIFQHGATFDAIPGPVGIIEKAFITFHRDTSLESIGAGNRNQRADCAGIEWMSKRNYE